MKKYLHELKIKFLFILLMGSSYCTYAQKDTIPPVITKHCGDTFNVNIGAVWIFEMLPISDNETDSSDIVVLKNWGSSGALNSLVIGIYVLDIEAIDLSGNKVHCTVYYRVDDFIPPLINLNTADTVCVKVNTPYNAVQPSVSDNRYTTSQISLVKVSTNVNSNIIGIYTEVYEAIDGSGNKTFKTRYVKVSANCATSGISNTRRERFTIYPNPANTGFVLNPDQTDQKNYMNITAMDGKVVFSCVLNGPMAIDTHSFASGIYTVLLYSGENLSETKLVVQH